MPPRSKAHRRAKPRTNLNQTSKPSQSLRPNANTNDVAPPSSTSQSTPPSNPSSVGPSNKPGKPQSQYHHYIPRFILRNFQVVGATPIERQKGFKRIDESVYFYDLSTGTLSTQPLGKVYGISDLYKDATDPEDVFYIEKKLSLLESRAALSIRHMHQAMDKGIFHIKRKFLNDLRKFLFIMHYRQPCSSKFWFDPTKNGSFGKWMEGAFKTHGFQNSTDLWLYVMRYYLDTPYSTIMQQGREATERFVTKKFLERAIKGFDLDDLDEDVEHMTALTYYGFADTYFMCIWEAADGGEFILSQNCFGLWEGIGEICGELRVEPFASGTCMGACMGTEDHCGSHVDLHRLFVLSPKLILVLARQSLRQSLRDEEMDIRIVNSLLVDIDHQAPLPQHKGGGPKGVTQDSLFHYGVSDAAQEDLFEFKITKLTVSQTRAVNRVMLFNIPVDTGFLTFLTKDKTLRLLRAYCSESVVIHQNRPQFRPLIEELSSSLEETIDEREDLFIDIPLYIFLIDALSGTARFRSDYDRTRALLSIIRKPSVQTPFLCEYVYFSMQAINSYRFLTSFRPAPHTDSQTRTHSKLVDSLPREDSNVLFIALWQLIKPLVFIPRPTSLLERIEYQAVMLEMLEWVLNNRPDKFDDVVVMINTSFRQQMRLKQ